MEEYLSIPSKLGRTIRTSKEYWEKIVTLKHPVMKGKEDLVVKTVEDPLLVKRSERDSSVYLYYRFDKNRYICVVVRHENGSGYIISTFPVDTVKRGEIIYEKNTPVS